MDPIEQPENPALQNDVASQLDRFISESPDAGPAGNPPAAAPALAPEWPTSPLGAHIAGTAVGVFANGIAPGWRMTQHEIDMIAVPLGQIVTAWLPTSPDQAMNPYIALIVGCAMVAGGKMAQGLPMRVPEQPAQEDQQTLARGPE